jgi:pSer/pThr/pTyr-binding forkhead associated (FHA) protein
LYRTQDGIKEVEIKAQTFSIGRGAGNDLQVVNSSISRYHCRIKNRLSEFFISDMNSRNGVLINGEPISYQKLNDRDVIQIGKLEMIFSNPQGTRMTSEEFEEVSRQLREGQEVVLPEGLDPGAPISADMLTGPDPELDLTPIDEMDDDYEGDTLELPDLPDERVDTDEFLSAE